MREILFKAKRIDNGEWIERDHEILRSASQIEIVNCLNDIWQAVKE